MTPTRRRGAAGVADARGPRTGSIRVALPLVTGALRPPPPWDLYAHALATAVLVVTITTAADGLGPAVSGVLTSFPIATSVLAAFSIAHDGPRAAAAMLRGFVSALPAFVAFFFVVAVAPS